MQQRYLDAVAEAEEAANLALQTACLTLYGSAKTMKALLLLHEMVAWGGTLARVADARTANGWHLARIESALLCLLPHYCL